MTESLTEALQDTAPTLPQTPASYLKTLVGEGKKYNTAEEMARAYHNADLHIEELKNDNAELRTNEGLLQEVLNELRDSPNTTGTENEQPPAIPAVGNENSNNVQVGAEDIANIVDKRMSEREAGDLAKANTQKTLKLLTEKYGSNTAALTAINTIINNDGGMKASLDALGASNPEAAVTFVTNTVPVSANISGTSMPGIGQSGSADAIVASSGGLTWSECRRLRKEDPKKYASPEFRAEIEAAVAKEANQGRDFFAT